MTVTATLEDVTTKKESPSESAELTAARELVRQAKEQGLSLTGPDGLLKQLTKAVLEAALNEELTERLGHGKPAASETGNVRNGTRTKTVLTEAAGHVDVEVSRDRAGTFEPQIVRKRQRRLSGVGSALTAHPSPTSAGDLHDGHLTLQPSPDLHRIADGRCRARGDRLHRLIDCTA